MAEQLLACLTLIVIALAQLVAGAKAPEPAVSLLTEAACMQEEERSSLTIPKIIQVFKGKTLVRRRTFCDPPVAEVCRQQTAGMLWPVPDTARPAAVPTTLTPSRPSTGLGCGQAAQRRATSKDSDHPEKGSTHLQTTLPVF